MREKRYLKGLIVAVSMGVLVAAVPAMAQEITDANPAEDATFTAENDIQTLAAVESVTVSADNATLYVVGQTTQMTVTVNPTDPTADEDYTVAWTSSNASAATVDANGLVTTGSKDGTATITCTVSYTDDVGDSATVSGTCVITVSLYNGIYTEPGGTNKYYYKNGAVDTSQNGVTQINGTTYHFEKGKVAGNTVAKYNGTWWYFNANGILDKSYTGFSSNSNGKWYCENGKVTFSKNSVLKDTTGAIGTKGDWYYVVGSKVQTDYTGVANYKNSNGWWYIKKGKVDFSANTVAKNKNGWWYVEGGKVRFSYNGFGENGNGKWYCENGKVTFQKNSVIKDTTGAIGKKGTWYYVVGSKVQTNFTGLANYKNSNGWWYITKGQVNFNYNGLAKNKNGWYYLQGGKVNFNYTGFASNKNGDWYVDNGKVTFKHTSVLKDTTGAIGKKGTWWYVSNSKVNHSYTGVGANSKGVWYIKDGQVDFSFSGTITVSGVKYTIKNGKADIPAGMSTTMYSKAQKQSSSTKWLVMVDVDNCKVGVFQGSKGNWAPVKCYICSDGKPSTPTVRGTYSILSKGKSFGQGYTCWYYSQFHGSYMLHSILYNPGSMTSVQDGHLGYHVSHGCVRLALENAKWIYDNVPIGSRVVTY